LPEELAVAFAEAHHDAHVAGDLRVARLLVVGADKDFAVRDHGSAVAVKTEFGDPLYVLLLFLLDAPRGWNSRFHWAGHVAKVAAPKHGPVGLGRRCQGRG